MLVGRGVVGAMTVGIRGVLVIVGAKGVRVVKGVAWRDDACEEDEDEGTEAVREEMSIVIVVEAAPEGSGDGVDRVGRIIELVLLSVNLGMEIDDEDEGIRLPAVDIGDDVRAGVGELSDSLVFVEVLDVVGEADELVLSSCPPTLVPGLVAAGGTTCVGLSVTGSRSDAGPVKVRGGDEVTRRDDGVGVSSRVDEDDVVGSKLVEGDVSSAIEELGLDVLSDVGLSAVALIVEGSLEDVRAEVGLEVSGSVELSNEESDELEVGVGVSRGEDVEGSMLVLGVVKVDNGTPVSLAILELDPSSGMIVTAGSPAWAPPTPSVLVVGIGVDVFENVKLRAILLSSVLASANSASFWRQRIRLTISSHHSCHHASADQPRSKIFPTTATHPMFSDKSSCLHKTNSDMSFCM